MIRLHPWSNGDLPILEKTLGNPAMMEHLGGAEDRYELAARHGRYLRLAAPGEGGMFTIRLEDSTVVGTVGFWERTWQGEQIYEAGWMVLPEYAGRGIASTAASAIVVRAKDEQRHRFLHAFPAVANVASNAVCEKAGFTNSGECMFEYPRGNFMPCNDWRIDLFAIEESIEAVERGAIS